MRELSLEHCRLDKRYDIRERLGRGSYAEIYLASDVVAAPNSPHSKVVVKALNVFLQDDLDNELERTLVENFQNEAIALDRVRHPNIISRLGHGTARDLAGYVFHYIVLEYLSGGDLQALVRKRPLSLSEVLGIVEQICAGLGHAHRQGVIHRDIKPQNLLLTSDHSTVKIADFGVARLGAYDSPVTRVGTNVYAPPEHSPAFATSREHEHGSVLSPASDIYSLAKTVYTLIAREAPRAFVNEPITSLPDAVFDEEWAESMLAVLRRSTLDDPKDRYQSTDDLWQALASVREQIEAEDESTVLRPRYEPPKAHPAIGYSPIVPEQPDFESVSETPAFKRQIDLPRRPVQAAPPAQRFPAMDRPNAPVATSGPAAIARTRKSSRFLRKLAAFGLFATLFAGVLYGTAAYIRNSGLVPWILSPFATRTGVANTDIYLRPDPSTDNDPIGLVTRNSKVRIVNSQNNWYQVDVVQQGRQRAGGPQASRGWLNGKYIDLDDK
ncbi:MAG: protein kinase [Acidobacteria bacterium]|nr:protein kinase [Acidobacteriota bacterium]MCW5949085.1 protein kinase [Pyrinomonadaceae bacterium]